MELRYTKWGLANRFNKYILVNKDLLEFPDLYSEVLKHELAHTDKLFSASDLKQDIKVDHFAWKIFWFSITHPRALVQLLPIWWYEGEFVFDLNMLFMWSFIVIGSLVYLRLLL